MVIATVQLPAGVEATIESAHVVDATVGLAPDPPRACAPVSPPVIEQTNKQLR